MKLVMTCDWNRAGIYLRSLKNNLTPTFRAQLEEDGSVILTKLQEHINRQDLDWTPLSEQTITLKGGDDTIYVDTGTLRDGLVVRKVKSSTTGSTFFVGASPWKKHKPSGHKLNDLMIWLEYGTDKIPARPLIQPTYEEVKKILQDNWDEIFERMIDIK